MNSHPDEDNAATNVDALVMFVAAIRAVAPDPPEASQLFHDLRDIESTDRARGCAQRAENQRFEHGLHLWTWIMNKYPIAAVLVCGLSAEQKDVAVHVLDGMLRESRMNARQNCSGKVNSLSAD